METIKERKRKYSFIIQPTLYLINESIYVFMYGYYAINECMYVFTYGYYAINEMYVCIYVWLLCNN